MYFFLSKVSIGDEVLLKFSGVPLGEACSVVLRGATEQIIGNNNKTSLGASAGLHFFGVEPNTAEPERLKMAYWAGRDLPRFGSSSRSIFMNITY